MWTYVHSSNGPAEMVWGLDHWDLMCCSAMQYTRTYHKGGKWGWGVGVGEHRNRFTFEEELHQKREPYKHLKWFISEKLHLSLKKSLKFRWKERKHRTTTKFLKRYDVVELRTLDKLVGVCYLVDWCFEPSQPLKILPGLKETFIQIYVVERTRKREIRPEEQSEKTESCRENLWNEIQSKRMGGPFPSASFLASNGQR